MGTNVSEEHATSIFRCPKVIVDDMVEPAHIKTYGIITENMTQ
jgi:hypothetical protein